MEPGPAQRRECLVTVLDALGDATRMHIVDPVLHEGEVACSSLDTSRGLAKSTVSSHTKILHAAGPIALRRDGRIFHSSPTPALRELEPILETLWREAELVERAEDCDEAHVS